MSVQQAPRRKRALWTPPSCMRSSRRQVAADSTEDGGVGKTAERRQTIDKTDVSSADVGWMSKLA